MFRLALAAFLSVLALSLTHRYLAFPFLSGAIDFSKQSPTEILAVGALSDVWIAALFSCIFLMLASVLRFAARGQGSRRLPIIFAAVFGILTAAHQIYVEFFRFQIVPFHLTYFGDATFIKTTWATFLQRNSLILLGLTAFLCLFLHFYGRRHQGGRFHAGLFVLTLIFATGAHALNIRLRVNAFVPQELQTHFLERLYYNLQLNTVPKALSEAEIELLKKRLAKNVQADRLPATTMRRVSDAQPNAVAQQIRRVFAEAIANSRSPRVITVLLESARVTEFGAYNNLPQPSITPQFDALSQSGILFRNAYSTGTVTRGGEEAVWCGYLGSQNTSMMRGRSDVGIHCLPRILVDEKKSSPGFTYFHHGFRGEFDAQSSFWRHQGVNEIVTIEDFPQDLPVYSWGVSDKELFKLSLAKLKAALQSHPPFIAGLILTATNHIPWQLPSDHNDLNAYTQVKQTHPSHSTTAYTDESLGLFVAGLKSSLLWEDTLLVLVSDHGSSVDHFYPQKWRTDLRDPESFAHSVLLLSGGVVEKALGNLHLQHETVEEFVSQADIAPFIAYVLGMDRLAFFGEPLLILKRVFPVLTDLGNEIYVPKVGRTFPRITQNSNVEGLTSEEEQFALAYYRAFLHTLNQLHSED